MTLARTILGKTETPEVKALRQEGPPLLDRPLHRQPLETTRQDAPSIEEMECRSPVQHSSWQWMHLRSFLDR